MSAPGWPLAMRSIRSPLNSSLRVLVEVNFRALAKLLGGLLLIGPLKLFEFGLKLLTFLERGRLLRVDGIVLGLFKCFTLFVQFRLVRLLLLFDLLLG